MNLSILRHNIRYVWWLPLYLLLFLLLEQRLDTAFYYTHCALDSYIPFCSWSVIPYLLWYPLLICIGMRLMLHDGRAFRNYMLFLSVGFFACELVWFLLPNAQLLRPVLPDGSGPLTSLVSMLYRIDTCTNVFPSAHVVGSVGAALAVRDSPLFSRRERFTSVVLCVLICMSTVLIKQHALLDVIGALVLSALTAVPVYRRVPTFRLRRKEA